MVERALFDVNVILDALLQRAPHAAAAEQLWEKAERGEVRGYVSAHGITTIFYLLRKQVGAAEATRVVGLLLQIFRVARVDSRVLASALGLAFSDFEDAVCAAAAAAANCAIIVTRDPKGFAGSMIPAFSPEIVLARWSRSPRSPRAKPMKRVPKKRR